MPSEETLQVYNHHRSVLRFENCFTVMVQTAFHQMCNCSSGRPNCFIGVLFHIKQINLSKNRRRFASKPIVYLMFKRATYAANSKKTFCNNVKRRPMQNVEKAVQEGRQNSIPLARGQPGEARFELNFKLFFASNLIFGK